MDGTPAEARNGPPPNVAFGDERQAGESSRESPGQGGQNLEPVVAALQELIQAVNTAKSDLAGRFDSMAERIEAAVQEAGTMS